MAEYTLEVRQLMSDPHFKMFDFEYPFYLESEKTKFEQLFIDHYFFHEIGFETIQRFKHMLRHRLNLIYPYYEQLYETELKSKDLNFLLNKDLKETFERESKALNELTNTSNVKNTILNDFKESDLDNGNASMSLSSGSLTTVNNTNVQNDTLTDNDSTNNINENEKTTLISQGNIGVTSTAELLKQWRDVLININQMIIENELNDLFMKVY